MLFQISSHLVNRLSQRKSNKSPKRKKITLTFAIFLTVGVYGYCYYCITQFLCACSLYFTYFPVIWPGFFFLIFLNVLAALVMESNARTPSGRVRERERGRKREREIGSRVWCSFLFGSAFNRFITILRECSTLEFSIPVYTLVYPKKREEKNSARTEEKNQIQTRELITFLPFHLPSFFTLFMTKEYKNETRSWIKSKWLITFRV